MRHSIPYYIREQLREQRSVSIPGLGMFYLTHQSARISDKKTHVSPPTLALSFDEVAGDEVPLLHRIMRVENIGLQKVKKKLSKYTESIFNVLINLNKVEIEGIGTLVRSEDEVIKFVDTVEELTDEFHGLREISLLPVKRITAMAEETGATTSYEQSNPILTEPNSSDKKPRRPWWIPLIGGILLALAYVLTMQTCEKKNAETIGADEATEQTIGQVGEDGQDSESIVNEDLSVSEQETGQDIIEEQVTEVSGDKGSKEEVAIIEEIEPIKEIVVEEIAAVEKQAELIPSTISVPKGQNDVNEIDYSQSTRSAGNSAIKSVAYDGSTCIVIVGSFTKAKNVLKMLQKVESLGYAAYSAAYGQFTRVGLKFNCIESDLPVYLAEVQSNLESKAWYLEAPGK